MEQLKNETKQDLIPKAKIVVKKQMSNEKRRALTGWLFISPWVVGFLIFVFYPLVRTVFFSFTNVTYSAKLGYQFKMIGMENYRLITRVDTDFMLAILNFIVRIFAYVPVIISLSIIIAMMLNSKLKGTTFFRLIFFLPIIILNGSLMENMSANGGMSLEVSGLIIQVFARLTPNSFMNVVLLLFNTIIELLWYCGVPVLIFLAALQKIDKSLYEAAQIDGASPWNIFWKITLPTVYPLVSVTIVYVVVFLANFDTNPIIDIILQSRTQPGRREGYASALSVLYALVQTVLIALLFFITKRRDKGGYRA